MPDEQRPLAAGAIVLVAMAGIAFTDTFFVRIAEVAGLWQFHLIRALIVLPILGLWAWWRGIRIVPNKKMAVLFRGLLFGLSMIFYFGSLGFLSVAQAAAGLFSSPLWVLIISALVFGEKIGPRRIGAVAVGFVGVLIVLQPERGLSWAQAMPIAGGFCYALAAISTRRWCQGESALSLLAAFFVWMIVICSIGVLVTGAMVSDPPIGPEGLLLRSWAQLTPNAWFWIGVQVVTAIVGVYSLTYAYQLADASYVAVFEYSFIVFAALWAAVLFWIFPTLLEMAGILMIILSGVLIALSPAARTQTGKV